MQKGDIFQRHRKGRITSYGAGWMKEIMKDFQNTGLGNLEVGDFTTWKKKILMSVKDESGKEKKCSDLNKFNNSRYLQEVYMEVSIGSWKEEFVVRRRVPLSWSEKSWSAVIVAMRWVRSRRQCLREKFYSTPTQFILFHKYFCTSFISPQNIKGWYKHINFSLKN